MDIYNPLHYIAVNNPDDTCQLLQQYTGALPRDASEIMKGVDNLSRHYGEPFINDMIKIHPDRVAIAKVWNLQPYVVNKNISNAVDEPTNPNQAASKNKLAELYKNNNPALLVLAIIGVMYIGSKIFTK